MWVVPVLNRKRTPVGAIIVDAQGGGVRGGGGTSRREMKELLSLMIKSEKTVSRRRFLVFLSGQSFP